MSPIYRHSPSSVNAAPLDLIVRGTYDRRASKREPLESRDIGKMEKKKFFLKPNSAIIERHIWKEFDNNPIRRKP